MDDRLGEIIDRLRDLDHRLGRLEQGGPRDDGPGSYRGGPPPGHHDGPPPGWHGGPPPGYGGPPGYRGPPPGWHGGHDDQNRDCRGDGRHHDGHDRHGHGGHRGGRHRDDRDDRDDRGGGDFDEKRIIDTIVRLTCENLAPIVEAIVARELDRRAPPIATPTESEEPPPHP